MRTWRLLFTLAQRHCSTKPPIIGHFDQNLLAGYDQDVFDPGRTPMHDPLIQLPHHHSLTQVYVGPFVALDDPVLPFPRSRTMLYRQLMYIISHRTSATPSPAVLIAYHSHFPTSLSLRSCRSYNLLLSLALRHASFAHVKLLLEQMHQEGIKGNLETWKLGVRWLVRTGKWDQAWRHVNGTLNGERPLISHYPHERAPLLVWLELFGTTKKRAFRKRTGRALQHPIDASKGEIDMHLSRYRMLMQEFPALVQASQALTPLEFTNQTPRTVYLLVQMMLRTEKRDYALSMTRSYLKSLPEKMNNDRCLRKCIDLVHLHIIWRSPQWGVKAHHAARKNVVGLLALHPALRPNSTTTLLLLSSLQRAKKCATVGWKFISRFRRRWGESVVDRRVRRRIASFALKEGRLDILKALEAVERISDAARSMWTSEEAVRGRRERKNNPTRKSFMLPDRKIYPGKGAEERRWRILRQRFRRYLRKNQ
jgi:hypothetical protein